MTALRLNWDGHQWDDAGIASPVRIGRCPFCRRVKRLSIVVIGRPRAELVTFISDRGVNVCGDCAPDAINQALVEADPCRPMPVVVPYRKAVAA